MGMRATGKTAVIGTKVKVIPREWEQQQVNTLQHAGLVTIRRHTFPHAAQLNNAPPNVDQLQ